MSEIQHVYFKGIRSKIIEYILKSKHEIFVAVAWITDDTILKALNNSLLNGVDVSVIFFNDKINNKDSFKTLFKNGATIHYTNKLMHNKFCVIDKTIIINGSYNWTNNARNNHENIQVTIDSPIIAQEYVTEFERIFQNSKSIEDYFTSEEDKFKEYLLSQIYPSSYPTFYKFDFRNYLHEIHYSKDDVISIFILLKDKKDFEYFHKYKLNRENKLDKFLHFYGLSKLKWFLNIYDLYNEIETNESFIYFTSEKMLAIQRNISKDRNCIFMINQKGDIVSEEIPFNKIKIAKDNIEIDYVNKINYWRYSLTKK
jgi:hypothetical protein